MIKNILSFGLSVVALTMLLTGCRDYVTGIGENEIPVLYTGRSLYALNDSVSIFLQNKSSSSIYVIGAYGYIERKQLEEWSEYVSRPCDPDCPEFGVLSKQIISDGIPVNNTGLFRFVCLYSFTPGQGNGDKIKVYSNEFTVK